MSTKQAGHAELSVWTGTGGAFAVLAFLLLVVSASIWPAAVAPPPRSAAADPDVFSAERAREHLREITHAPRPVGAPAHAATREYLRTALAALGMETETQRTTAVSGDWGRRAAHVENLVARLPGTGSTGAVLLASHYDSAPHSFGATDAGHGVAAILETVRALRSGPPLRNDLIVLFTDAEEVGLLGATAFVAEHRLAGEVAIVLNAEGRGNEGPVFLTRTSSNGGELIRTAAQSVRGPAANSLTAAVLRYIPNDTDLTIFLRAGMAGMDMANGHGLTHYHTPLDSFERASPRTLQHHGEYLLGLARELGGRDLGTLSAPDRVYFTLPVLRIVHYPAAWALPLALLALLVVGGVLVHAARGRSVRDRGVLIGLVALLASATLLPAAAYGAWSVLRTVLPDTTPSVHGFGYDRVYYLVFLVTAVTGIFLAALGAMLRRATAAELLVAPLAGWSGLAVASAVLLPGGSYLFLWPVAGAGCAMAVLLSRRSLPGVAAAILLTLCAVPILLIVPQVIYMLEVVLTLDAIAVPILILGLLLTLLVPQLVLVRCGLGRGAPAIFLTTAGIALFAGIARAGFDADRPRPVGVTYLSDPERGEALWTTANPSLTAWTRSFLGDAPARRALPGRGITAERWVSPAPLSAMLPPRVEVVSSQTTSADRTVRLRIVPGEHGWQTVLSVVGPGAARNVRVNGRAIAGEQVSASGTIVSLYGSPPEGFQVSFTVPAAVSAVRVREVTPGLPDLPGRRHPVPPPEFMTADFTMIDRIVDLR